MSFKPSYHDHTLFFDDDGRIYMIYGAGKLKLIELNEDLSGVKPNTTEQVVIENASAPAGENIMLNSEGSQLFKVNGKYYLFNIVWPKGGMRTVIIHRADKITGPYEGQSCPTRQRALHKADLLICPMDGGFPTFLEIMERWVGFRI